MQTPKKNMLKKILNRFKSTKIKVYALEKVIHNKPTDNSLDEKAWGYLSNGSLDAYLKIREAEESTKYTLLFQKRIKRGDRCWLLYYNDNPVAYLWTSTQKHYVEPVNYWLILNNDCFAIYDVFTIPSFRGKGCYKRLLRYVEGTMTVSDYSRVLLYVMKHNINAINAQHKCGFVQVNMEITYRSCCGIARKTKSNVNYPIMELINAR